MVMENLYHHFFAGLQLIAGPNKSSSYSVINGVVSQSASYTYYFSTDETEIISFHLLSWRLVVKIIKSTPVKIYVAPNPDNIGRDLEMILIDKWRFTSKQ